MDIFKFKDYRQYVTSKIKNMPRGGRGEYLRIAKSLSLHTSTVSQIFKGQKNLTLAQGVP